MAETNQRIEAVISGRVQGVGFRHFATVEARRHQLAGFVRNERNGSVTVVAEGGRGNLEEFLEALHDGPPSARVDAIETAWNDPSGEFQGFGVRWN